MRMAKVEWARQKLDKASLSHSRRALGHSERYVYRDLTNRYY
jgi:hypothetical protein